MNMSDIDEKFPHLPEAYRRRMAEREQAQNHQTNDDENAADDESKLNTNDADDDFAQGGDTPNEQEQQHDEVQANDDVAKLRNDLSSERGRRQKLEEEIARLRVLAENGSFAAQRLMEIQAEREQKQNQTEQSEQVATDDFDFDALADELGDVPVQALRLAHQKAKQANDEVLSLKAQMAQQEAQQRRELFAREVATQIPEIQVLLQDDDFNQFLANKQSWDGSTALQFVGNVAQNINIDGIPKVRALIDEYQQSQQAAPKQRKPTSPPKRQSGGGGFEQEPALKTMTDKDRAHLLRLARTGKKAEILAFKAQFKKE